MSMKLKNPTGAIAETISRRRAKASMFRGHPLTGSLLFKAEFLKDLSSGPGHPEDYYMTRFVQVLDAVSLRRPTSTITAAQPRTSYTSSTQSLITRSTPVTVRSNLKYAGKATHEEEPDMQQDVPEMVYAYWECLLQPQPDCDYQVSYGSGGPAKVQPRLQKVQEGHAPNQRRAQERCWVEASCDSSPVCVPPHAG